MASNIERAKSRRLAFMKAAEQVFFAQGFAGANIQEVVRLARGSMATLYAQFGSKEGLFQALIDHQLESLRNPLDHLDVAGKGLEEGLRIIGEAYLNSVLQEAAVALYKVLVAEGRNFPDLMQRIMPRRLHVYDATADFLEGRKAAGEIGDIDSAMVATLFLDMIRGQHQMRVILDPEYRIENEDIRTFVAQAVDLLCGGLRNTKGTEARAPSFAGTAW